METISVGQKVQFNEGTHGHSLYSDRAFEVIAYGLDAEHKEDPSKVFLASEDRCYYANADVSELHAWIAVAVAAVATTSFLGETSNSPTVADMVVDSTSFLPDVTLSIMEVVTSSVSDSVCVVSDVAGDVISGCADVASSVFDSL